jgi:hypothetical protein
MRVVFDTNIFEGRLGVKSLSLILLQNPRAFGIKG